jgi:hypothetical protein
MKTEKIKIKFSVVLRYLWLKTKPMKANGIQGRWREGITVY